MFLYSKKNRALARAVMLGILVFALTMTVLLSADIFAVTSVFETESLTVAASSGDVHRVFGMNSGPDANLSGGYGTILEANAVNDYVTYTVNVPQAGSCNVRVGVKKSANRGIFQFAVNGTNHGSPQDLYSATDTYNELDVSTFTFGSAGSKSFTFTVTGKNTASSNYWLAFDYIKLLFSDGTTTTISGSGIQVNVDPSIGAYSVVSSNPAWTFSGSLSQVLSGIGTTSGTDTVGAYQETYFNYQSNSYEGRIRVYTNSKPVVVFKTKSLNNTNTNLGPYFPNFSIIPSGLTAHGMQDACWFAFQFTASSIGSNSPALYYDNNANAFIISPAANFMSAYASYSNTSIACGLQNWTNDSTLGIKNGYTHSVMLAIGQGINKTFDLWGNALTDYQNKVRPANDADTGLKYVGLWSDEQPNDSYGGEGPYWYNLNGFANYDAQFMAVKAKYDSLKIKLNYYQLDSWWYIKDPNNWLNRPGAYQFTPVPSLFPNGLVDLKNRLGVSYITHHRWIGGNVSGDVRSPYRDQYVMSNGASIDPAFWDKVVGDEASWGVKTFEHDWLDNNASPSNIIGHGEKFMDEMARATSANGMTMQYCMEKPRHIMQASKYSNLTTLRTCGDRFDMPGDWGQNLWSSQWIHAVGAWPWVDHFFLKEVGNDLLCVLSAGMVGVEEVYADITNSSYVANLHKMVRNDGLSIKSDVPLVPSDATYIRRAAGTKSYTCSTYSTVSNQKVVYVFDWANTVTNYNSNFKPADFGMSGNVYVYNYFDNKGYTLSASSAVTENISGSTTSGTDYHYYIIAPIGALGMAMLGDQGKFVTFSKNRIRSFSETSNSITISVAFGAFDASNPDQAATIFGYSPTAVTVTAASGGAVSNQTYDSTTHIFKFTFQPSGSYSGEVLRSVTITKN